MEASKQKNVSGAAAAAAAQEVMVEGRDAQSRQRPDRLLRQERYNYMKAGQVLMKDCEVVSVAADAVSVGNDHILNVFLWNNVAEKAFHCPPQALASVLDLFWSEMSEFPQSERRHMPEVSLRHICRKCLSATYAGSVSLNGPRTYAGSVSPFCGQNHLKKDDFGISPTYAGSVSLNGPKHICRKCLSVFARPKGKKPTAHICRKCLSKGSETHMPEVSLRCRPTKRKKAYGPHMPEVSLRHICRKCLSKSRFWRRFFHLKKDDFGHFSTSKMASGKEAPGFLFKGNPT